MALFKTAIKKYTTHMKLKLILLSICLVSLSASLWAQSPSTRVRHHVERVTSRSVAQRYIRAKEQFLQQYRQTFGVQGYVTLYTSSAGPSLRGRTDKMLQLHVPEKAALTCWTLLRQSRVQAVPPLVANAGERLQYKTKKFAFWQILARRERVFIQVRMQSLTGLLARVAAPENLMDAYIAGKQKPSQLGKLVTFEFCPQVTDPALRAQLNVLPNEDKPRVSVEALY